MSILTSAVPDRYQASRQITKKDTNPIPHRWYFVLSLRLAGHSPTQDKPDKPSIRSLTGYSQASIHRILSEPDVISARQQILEQYDREFEDMYALVVEGVRKHLESASLKDVEVGAKIWLQEFGKQSKIKQGGGDTYNVTAEDVVFNMLKVVRGEDA